MITAAERKQVEAVGGPHFGKDSRGYRYGGGNEAFMLNTTSEYLGSAPGQYSKVTAAFSAWLKMSKVPFDVSPINEFDWLPETFLPLL